MEIFGWIGAVFMGGCAIPQTWQSIKDGHTRGLNWGFLGSWFIGECAMLIYILPMNDLALSFNYVLNFVLLLIMLRYKVWERNDNKIRENLEIHFSERHL